MQTTKESFNNRVVPLRQSTTGNHPNASRQSITGDHPNPLRQSITGSHATVPMSQARRARQVRIGKILEASGLISTDCLHEALTISQELQQPIGKVLTSTQQVADRDLQSALLAQSMMAEGLVEENVAMEALKIAYRDRLPFGQALETVNAISFHKSPVASGIEELLLASGMVSQSVLDEAKRVSMETGMTLGSSLMSTRAIVFAHLNFVFECITLIGAGRISQAVAVKALALIKFENVDLSEALKRQRISPKSTQSKLKLGDLLTAGSVVTEKDALTAIESALTEKRLIGEILVRSGLISQELLQDALEMQNLVVKEVITKDEAAFVLRSVVAENQSVFQILKNRKSLQDDASTAGKALDLLIKAKLVEIMSIPQAMAKQQRYEMDALKALVASDLLGAVVCRAAIETARRVANGDLTQQQAVLAIHHCDRTRAEIEHALLELGMNSEKVATTSMVEEAAKSKTVESQSTPYSMPSWTRSFECIMAVVGVVLGVAGGIATSLLYPNSFAGYCACGCVLAVGLLFYILGKSWERRLQDKQHEIKKQEEAAQQQVSRLVKIRTKESY
ncbi:MAG: hypothetical protein SGJ27_28295 [Candidatus Melainabacteria bacterium]|nr:hypothetical protein [Candidatus Melainabacteria bacterium]